VGAEFFVELKLLQLSLFGLYLGLKFSDLLLEFAMDSVAR